MGRVDLLKGLLLVGDFETTVYEGQTDTEVWASAIVPLWTEDVQIYSSIDETFLKLYELANEQDVYIFYHNLKFDGSFWLNFLLDHKVMREAYIPLTKEFYPVDKMPINSFTYIISDRGMWYEICIRTTSNHRIYIRDSLKILPFSVREIGKGFNTKHRKLELNYEGFRKAHGEIADYEKVYISNDVLVVKEALEIMFENNHKGRTIGSCCMTEFKRTIDYFDFDYFFPNLYDLSIGQEFGSANIGEYIHRSYKGGWCYLVEGKENKIYKNGLTADVNSLYPSVMSSESGNIYPIGVPTFWKGEINPFIENSKTIYYFIRIKTRFRLKEGKLPFIQVKSNPFYKPTECLKTSDIRDKEGNYHDSYIDIDGNRQPAKIELTLTCTDYKLFKEHYHLYDTEYLDGCWFKSKTPAELFDEYIQKWKQIKINSKGAMRTLAKLFLNNLYGKMATWINNSYKHAYFDVETHSLKFEVVDSYTGKPGYIPVGSAITSYARNFTIRAAQMNFHGVDKPGFIYADTDSIHCDLKPDQLIGLKVHPTDFCCWKLESYWDEAIFVRQKTYIEHVTHEDGEPVEKPYYNIKCAGMNEKCKFQFNKSLTQEPITKEEMDKYNFNEKQIEFMQTPRNLSDFKVGLEIYGKLRPKQIKGGTLLVETTYKMR